MKNELLSWLPQSQLSYPVIFPSELNYPVFKFGLFHINVKASMIKASNIAFNASQLDIDFMQEETLSGAEQPSFIVNGIKVNSKADLNSDSASPPLPIVKIIVP